MEGTIANKDVVGLAYKSKIAIRKEAPTFECAAWVNNRMGKVNLKDYRGKYVVLFFWPMDFTFVCPTEICNFSDKAKEFREIGCEIIGCSVDSAFVHMEYTKKDRKKGGLGRMDIPMVADVTKQIVKDYGCMVDHGDEEGVAYRATYIIDTNGILRHYSINDLPVGRNIDEIYRLVTAFQYTDEYGEVCPASWRKGKKAMKPEHDSTQLNEFWEKEHGKKPEEKQ